MGNWGGLIGQSFARYFADTKRDKILATMSPNDIMAVVTGPYGGIIVSKASVIAFRGLGREVHIPIETIRSVEMTRGRLIYFLLRSLSISYVTQAVTSRYQIWIDKKSGKAALQAIG